MIGLEGLQFALEAMTVTGVLASLSGIQIVPNLKKEPIKKEQIRLERVRKREAIRRERLINSEILIGRDLSYLTSTKRSLENQRVR